MSALRAPTVGGLAGGVGTSTVAHALRGRDLGPVGGAARLPDVVVCRASVSGLERAARIAPATPGAGHPVLAVTTDGADTSEGPLADRLRDGAAGWAALVLLPRVLHWPLVGDPLAEATSLLTLPADDLPEPVRDYARALTRIVEALTAGGRLERADAGTDGVTGPLRPVRGVRIGPPEPETGGRRPGWSVPVATGLAW
ncbi:hypothetical protein EV383_0580 [Pseudonocardia sediminis]|uniref:Uncharacterized protein n=1 Tax=Pseudonocardia sediminis TaxID=1397368 RepID=A0A4Q7UPV9_PSEST|nr:hypothetical protein [Pseudonocardia sediminis]RZT83762.1 hypothetical protein EV383_0580 [Pseudonocardia sediminis]